jgi:alkanesulfonate monooxygenase SsuD/methylene tetrahydromethanopterin reductase-like flavin-dependent oxidoreductase (luciferase family)
MGTASLKGFFAPGRPYVQGQKDIYDQLLARWGGSEEVPDDLKQNFSRYIENIDDDSQSPDGTLDYSGGGAITNKVWDGLTPDTLCERGVTISGNPDDCIAALKKHEATGIDEMLVMMQLDSVTHEQVMDSIRLWGKYIIPEFNKSASKVG